MFLSPSRPAPSVRVQIKGAEEGSPVEKLLKEWSRAIAEQHFHEASAFCAPRGLRRAALHRARMAAQRAQRLEKILRTRYNVDPYELLRRGEIK